MGIYTSSNPQLFYVYNNTVYNSGGECYLAGYGTTLYLNNIAQNCGSEAYYATYGTSFDSDSGNNISDDWTAPGADSQTTTTVSFVDAANDDFHLSESETTAINAGTSSVFWNSYFEVMVI